MHSLVAGLPCSVGSTGGMGGCPSVQANLTGGVCALPRCAAGGAPHPFIHEHADDRMLEVYDMKGLGFKQVRYCTWIWL
jgi:hypothetical protein